jgi:hypothetical protein
MADDPRKGIKPLFVETSDGTYVNADNVASIAPRNGSPHETLVRNQQGGAHTIKAPFSGVKEIFAQHGYQFVTADDMKKAAGPMTEPPSAPPKKPVPPYRPRRVGGGGSGTIF